VVAVPSKKNGEPDLAGVHLQDEETGQYNVPFITRYGLERSAFLIRGYDREQGLIVRRGNPNKIREVADLLRPDISFINRNKGSGTRLLIDRHLTQLAATRGTDLETLTGKIQGYSYEAKTHSAVATAVKNDRADVGFGIRTVAETPGLEFVKLDDEKYDFLIPKDRIEKKSVSAFLELLRSQEFSRMLTERAPGLTAGHLSGTVLFRPS